MKLSERIRSFYEDRFRYLLPRKAYYVLRIDGKNFSNYTRRLKKPFDPQLVEDFNSTTIALCREIPGSLIGYTQSDEISVVFTDTASYDTELWYDGNIQKICSVSASLATSLFCVARPDQPANFDGRVFPLPKEEVKSYLIARQNDAIRNAISSVAYAQFSHRSLERKKTPDKLAMLKGVGISLDDYPTGAIVGRTVIRLPTEAGPTVRLKFQVAPNNPLFREFDFKELLGELNSKTRAEPSDDDSETGRGDSRPAEIPPDPAAN